MQALVDAGYGRPVGETEKALQHALGATAKQTGKPDDLTRAHTDRIGARLNVLDEHVARKRTRCVLLSRCMAGHGLDEIGGAEFAAPRERNRASVAQYGASVGELNNLLQAVGHIDNGRSLTSQLAEHCKKPTYFAIFQCRRWFVENEHTAIATESLGKGNNLLLCKAEAAYGEIGIWRKVKECKLRTCILAHPRVINDQYCAK